MVKARTEKIAQLKDIFREIWKKWEHQSSIQVKQLQKFTGLLQSQVLAIPHVRIMTRGCYSLIAMATERNWKWIKARELRGAQQDLLDEEMRHWEQELGKVNGLPIGLVKGTRTMYVDAGDLGFGGVLDGTIYSGVLPPDALGASSTRRELSALRLVAHLARRELKDCDIVIKMDSAPAIRNLIKGGGDKPDLTKEVRAWTGWCERHGVRPTYEWIEREFNGIADEASKWAAEGAKVPWAVRAKIHEDLKERTNQEKQYWWNSIFAPAPDKIGIRMIAAAKGANPCIVVVPSWPSQAWWNLTTGLRTIDLGTQTVGEITAEHRAVILEGEKTKEENKPKWR